MMYSVTEIQELINYLEREHDYSVFEIEDGVLGFGRVIAAPNRENQYFFIIEEKHLNEWSSAHTVRRTRRPNKKDRQALLDFEYDCDASFETWSIHTA